MHATPLVRFLLWLGAVFAGYLFLFVLFEHPLGAIILAPFLLLAWGLWGQVVLALFGSDEIPLGDTGRRPAAASSEPADGSGGAASRGSPRKDRGLGDFESASAGVVGAWLALRDPEEEDPDPDEWDPDDEEAEPIDDDVDDWPL